MRNIVLFFLMLSFTFSSIAQNKSYVKAEEVLLKRGEIYFRFLQSDNSKEVVKLISFDKVQDNYVYAYANTNDFNKIKNLISGFELLSPPSLEKEIKMAKNLKEVMDWATYPTYDQYVTMMNEFATQYPNLCRIEQFGTSKNGRALLIVKVSDNVSNKEAEPEFLYTSSMHGDEITGYVLMLRLIDYLLSNYGTNTEITDLVNNTEIWINPLSNPDGTFFISNNSINGAIRFNGNFIDINRNFPDPKDGDHPDGNAWQPETIAWMEFMTEHNFVMAGNFHGGSEVMNYPWDTYTHFHADDTWLQRVSRNYATSVQTQNPGGYFTDLNNGITHGNTWYEITGGRQDYSNYFKHCREITFEISEDKNPPASELPSFWNWSYQGLIDYMKEVQYGISGIVTDSITGEPLRAFIEVLNHDADSSQIYSDSTNGNYHRLIQAGTFDLHFSSPGYISKIILSITSIDLEKTVLDVQLVKSSSNISSFEYQNKINVYPNPASNEICFENSDGYTHYNLKNTFGETVLSGKCKSNLNVIDLKNIKSGIYTFSLSNNITNSINIKLVIEK